MAEEDGTREVLFPDWEGTDKTGLTIEQTGEGEIFVKEVKDESPAGRSGRVHEGTVICKTCIRLIVYNFKYFCMHCSNTFLSCL